MLTTPIGVWPEIVKELTFIGTKECAMSDLNLAQPSQKEELTLFLFLTVVLAPIIALSIISGYGLFIWVSQIVGGPPTH